MSKELALEENTLHPLVAKAQAFEITDASSMTEAVEMLSEVNRYNDALEADKDKIMRPALDTVNEIRARYKPRETILGAAITALRGKITAYQTAARAKEAIEAAKIADRAAEGKIKPETAVRKLDEIDTAETKIQTDQGSLAFRTVPVFEIEDLSKIPLSHMLPNEQLIRSDMKKGIHITGVKYSTEEQPINRRS